MSDISNFAALKVDVEASALPTGAATEASLASVKTAVELIDNAISGTEMQVDIVASLPAGTNNIGDVDVASLPAGNLGQQLMAASLSMVPANNITDATYIGDVKFGESLPAGTNNIGDVDIASALPAGTNNIGDVDVASLPAGNLGQQLMAASLSMVPASNINDATYIGDIKFGEALPAGTNNIGDVDIVTLPVGEAANDALFARLSDGTNVISATNPLPVNIVDAGAGTYTDTYGLSAAVAAGATWSFDSGTFANAAYAGVVEVTASSTVPLRVALYRTINGSEDANASRVFFVSPASPNLVYRPADDSFVSGTGGVGTNKFTLKIKNIDTTDAANIYASITFTL